MTSPVTFTVTPYVTNGPTFVAWAGGISAALDSAGLARQADTGVVTSWSAQALPSTSTAPYFEIRKLAAPATGACQVYIRMAYGLGPGTRPTLWISTGTGTDGAGNLTGPGSAIAPANIIPDSSDNALRTCYATCDGDGFMLFHSLESATTRFLLVVDRQRRPADGVAAPYPGFPDTGYMRLSFPITSVSTLVVDGTSGGAASLLRVPPAVIPRTVAAATTMVNAAGQTTFIPYVIATRQGSYFAKMLLAVPLLDTQIGIDMPISHLGATRTYRALGSTFVGVDVQANLGMACAIWWED